VKKLTDSDRLRLTDRHWSRDKIGEGHVRFLSRIKDLDARVKTAKRAADEGWTVKMTEERVAKLLDKAHQKSRKSGSKPAADDEFIYNHFHCALIGNEVELSGRRFKKDEEMLDEYVAAFRSAIQCFLRDLEDRSRTAQATVGSSELTNLGTPSVEAIPVAPPPPTPSGAPTSTDAPVDLVKEAANFESAGQSLKDLFAEIANKNAPTDAKTNPQEPGPKKASNS